MLSDVAGITVGHWSDPVARTGMTVALFPPDTVASAEVRGGAPASRDLDLLQPGRLVDHIDAVVLTGGSAFGLAAADGVMGWLEEHGRGFATPAGPVPIVPALALFDLGVGDASVRPGPDEGRLACDDARTHHDIGPVGAGTGATIDKWRGVEHARAGGLVTASLTIDGLVVSVLIAVNAAGDVDTDGSAAASWAAAPTDAVDSAFANTTIGVIATNARLDKVGCHLLAQSAHDGLARSVFPAHTASDGDAFVAAATGSVDAEVALVRLLVVAATEAAIRSLGSAAAP